MKKLEFEPIFTELQDRLRPVYQSVMVERARELSERDRLQRMKEELASKLAMELVEGDQGGSALVIRTLAKTQVHLLRVMTCEFLFHHIINNIQNLN